MIFASVQPYFATILNEPLTVAASVFIAVLATYLALELAGRLHGAPDRVSFRLWLIAGSIAMGSGIWSMHFVGMSAVTYPFPALYGEGMTAISWLAAVVVSALVLLAASREAIAPLGFVVCGLVGGIGATGMHFIGMRAMLVAPAPTTNPSWVVAAALAATVGATTTLVLFNRLRGLDGGARIRRQLLAALVFGISLAAMHYLAMASTSFANGSVCVTRAGLSVDGLGKAVSFASILGLSLIFVVVVLERRADFRAKQIHGSLALVREELEFVTFNDPVTGLPNRLVFDDRLHQAVARCERSGGSLAVLAVNLDHFATVGLQADGQGALLLRAAAEALCGAARDEDTVASIGFDRFLVIVESGDAAAAAMQIVERFATRLRDPAIACTASVGITLFPQDGGRAELVSNADIALRSAQRDGGNGFRFFEMAMDEAARSRNRWLADLRQAIGNGELALHYQPKVYARDAMLAGVEALLRWHHPLHGLISPAVFIPLAEQYGLIDALGGWVIDEAARQMRAWSDEGLRVPVAINVSPWQLRRPGLADEIIATLRAYDVDAALLTCEVTESGAMRDAAASTAIFERLGAAGILIAIDDFGTGYSSLAQLRRMPVRQLKIDRSFIADLVQSADARAIVAAVVQMSHTLRLDVVAEGVETEEQRRVLFDLGCDEFQGFLFARPMPAADLVVRLRDRPWLKVGDSTLMAA